MRTLFIGDIVGPAGIEFTARLLPGLIREEKIDFVIANGENSALHNGITPAGAETLRYAGVDVITLGNHAFRQKSGCDLMYECGYVIRPGNFPSEAPGQGTAAVDTPFGRVGVINAMGQLYMISCDNPFTFAKKAVEKLSDCDYIFMDFHAEATSEKQAMGFYLDGKITCFFGTHTHVQTNDFRILPKGSGYISDVGMVGGRNSVLGVCPEGPVSRFVTGLPAAFAQAEEDLSFCSVIFDSETKEMIPKNIT